MQGVELVKDEKAGDRTPAVEATLRLFEETKKRGLLIGRGGLYSNVLRVAPPLVVGKSGHRGRAEDPRRVVRRGRRMTRTVRHHDSSDRSWST